jgi:uncharacterized membrane protein
MTDYPPNRPPQPAGKYTRLPATAAVFGALAIGVVAGTIAVLLIAWQGAPLIGWDAAALAWAVWEWSHILRYDAVATSVHATRDDPSRATAALVLLGASLASLIAVGSVIVKASNVHGGQRTFFLAVAVFSVGVSWLVVHTNYTLRYAALYYAGPDGGIDFNEEDKPSYADFAYLSFTIGMTYQVSDTNLKSKAVRHTALRHGLLSYVFGTVIVAATINLLAGLAGH